MSILEKFNEHIKNIQNTEKFLSFEEYFDLVKANPRIAQLAHARVYGMIKSAGVTEIEEGDEKRKVYNFFSSEIFGVDDVIEQLVSYLHSSAKRLEIRKRILLLMGPPGGGKSTLVSMLKRGLEEFTLTDDGQLYAIANCPMHEEPLHAVPHKFRQEIYDNYHIYIEGDLCPRCRLYVQEDLGGDFTKLQVKRIVLSEKGRIGIGVFQPNDPKSQDISDLVGSIDLSTIGTFGSESDPRAYRFDGEANVANRGILEMVEMLKVDEKFLYLLLTLSQEQSIKAGRFPLIYADEFIISHTNESEYKAWIADKKSEALRDRVIVLKCPYNLKIDEEVKIYEKLIKQTSILNSVHIDPQALRTAATFAVLTRLEDPKKAGLDLMKKLKLYNGEDVPGYKDRDVKELKQSAEREGMFGIGPRYIINQLAKALVQEGHPCLTTIDTLRALKNGLETSPSFTKEERDVYEKFIIDTRKDYDDRAKIEVQKAFIFSFEEQANTLLAVYLDNVEAFCNKEKVRDPITGEELDPDEKLMRSIEEQISVSENSAKSFREDILIRLSSYARRGKQFTFDSHPLLKEAIEKKLFADLKDVIRITTSTKTPDREQLQKLNEVAERLMNEHGYCEVCSHELLKYVGTLLNR
jgi:serine protein kinase